MTAITEKVTSCLETLNSIDDLEGKCHPNKILLDFSFLASVVRNDMLGGELTREQRRTIEAIYQKGAAKG